MKRSASYAWARLLDPDIHPEYAGFVDETHFEADPRLKRGLKAARLLAEHSRERRTARLLEVPRTRKERYVLGGVEYVFDVEDDDARDAREWELLGLRLDDPVVSAAELADAEYARRVLFGAIGDRAIRYRLDTYAAQRAAPARVCELCSERALPLTARSTRQRCDECRDSGRRRVRPSQTTSRPRVS
ncbi:MAG TPA: hypothetical protein VMK83_02085 [Gaiellaceae bacterium]|nr:hypothetical protein [Gaiellaceae bacterium]